MEETSILKNKYFWIVIIILIPSIAGAYFGVKYLLSGGYESPTERLCAQEPPEEVETVILNDYSSDNPWWNDEYSYFKQISVENTNSSTLPEDCLVTIKFNHSLFVEDKRSRADGGDLRLVYLSEGAYQEVPIQVTEPNTSSTRIIFDAANTLDSGTKDDNYFLYYGNASATLDDSFSTEGKSYAQNMKIYINKIVYPKISGEVNRHWIIKDTDVFDEYSELNYTLRIDDSIPPDSTPTFEIFGLNKTAELEYMGKGLYYTEIDANQIPVGSYQIQSTLISDGKEYKSVKSHIMVSRPLYVTWTMDWEGSDVPDEELTNMDEFSKEHGAPITHMFNPSIYVSPDISATRADELTKWVINRESKGDEIAMHLHMHYYLVSAAKVTPRETPKWTNYLNNGHDVPMSAYTQEELDQIIEWSVREFLNQGLPAPVSFRAGGWFADLKVLQALENNGFIIDTSGRDSYVWGANRLQGHWNLSATTHPYHPSKSDQNSSSPYPVFSLWEFPNNGADSWFHKSDELIARFETNYNKQPLDQTQALTYLSHPHQIHTDIEVLTPTFDYIDNHLASSDQGPVIYMTLRDAYEDMI